VVAVVDATPRAEGLPARVPVTGRAPVLVMYPTTRPPKPEKSSTWTRSPCKYVPISCSPRTF
jgi:hypothetical protein